MKKHFIPAITGIALALGVIGTTVAVTASPNSNNGQVIKNEKHPRIKKAIADLQDAIDYMQKSPDDFGGHKADAIRDAQKAISSLQMACQENK
jgi:hypothetical protein